ncbi:MAG: hypothetical protein MK479_02550 [Planctomycetes bacterium]|nr:hypothetical protein [Planctomycetota bacterium]
MKLADPRLGKIESLADFPHGQLFAAGQDNDQPVPAVEPSRDELANFLLFERGLVIKPVLVIKSEDDLRAASGIVGASQPAFFRQ